MRLRSCPTQQQQQPMPPVASRLQLRTLRTSLSTLFSRQIPPGSGDATQGGEHILLRQDCCFPSQGQGHLSGPTPGQELYTLDVQPGYLGKQGGEGGVWEVVPPSLAVAAASSAKPWLADWTGVGAGSASAGSACGPSPRKSPAIIRSLGTTWTLPRQGKEERWQGDLSMA